MLPSVDGLNFQPTIGPKQAHQVPQSARIWDYWLGGKDHYAVDRMAGDAVAEIVPGIIPAAHQDREFLGRAVRYLAQEGVRQFLDIGTGLPAMDNTHQLAQRVTPDARVVYVDNDLLVLAYARALLVPAARKGVCAYINADARDVDTIVREAAKTLDFSRPVGLMLLGILNHVLDDGEAHRTVEGLVAALAPGSHVVIAHPTDELDGERLHDAMRLVMGMGGTPVCARTPKEIASFFDGLELLAPGVVSCSRWRPDSTAFGTPSEVLQFCGVARKT